MAVEVKVGDVYTEVKIGSNSHGPWGNATAHADKGTDKIIIWFSNAEDVPEGTYAVEVEEIKSANLKANNYNGTWYKTYSVQAKVKPVEGGATAIDLDDTPF